MGDNAVRVRAKAIEGFAAVLSQLRDSVGRPSFRSMAGRSGAISHTTLHEAVQGNRLPSWATTAEFVRACGADPLDYRERWEDANRALGSVGMACPVATTASGAARTVGASSSGARLPDPTNRLAEPPDLAQERSFGVRTPGAAGELVPAQAGPPSGVVTPAGPQSSMVKPAGPTSSVATPASPPSRVVARPAAGRSRRRDRGWYAVLGATTVGVLATGAGVAWWRAGPDPSPPVAPPRYVASDCPVHQTNPPVQRPAHEGDSAAFVADITLPDCVHVGRGQTVSKVWRLKNSGSVPWTGYTLHRIDLPQTRDQCQTISDVPIADTPPGDLVDVKVLVTTPTTSGFCFVRFKMVDAQGKVAFPASRPVNFQVVVD